MHNILPTEAFDMALETKFSINFASYFDKNTFRMG